MKPLGFKSLGIVLLLLAAGCSSSRKSEESEKSSPRAIWQSQPLTIDGSDRDWVKPLPYTVHEENVNYSISNDQQNLYVLMSTSNPLEQQKIIQGGMSVWVNTKGDKSIGDAVGIGYPLNEGDDPDRKLMEEAQPQRYQQKIAKLEDKKTYGLYGFNKDSTIRKYNYGDTNYIGVVMRMDYNNSGGLIYEAAIPLQALYPGHDPSTPYPTQNLAVGIFIEPLPSGTRIPGGGGRGGGSPVGVGIGAGMGGFGSGVGLGIGLGREFGAGNGRSKPNKTLFDEAQIWQVVQLARK
jgi:hypothetical protein